MEDRLLAVHDFDRENVRLEKAPDSIQSPAILVGGSWAAVLQSGETFKPPEMLVAQADATGRIHLVSASVRPFGRTDVDTPESILPDVVLSSNQSQRTSGKTSDANFFLNERIRAVLPKIRGRLLDVGCGTNELVRRYKAQGGDGIGVDYIHHGWRMGEKFDTVTLVAVLNYVPEGARKWLLEECHDRLTRYGRLIVTCISPLGGTIHRFIRSQEPSGISRSGVRAVIESCGFRLVYQRSFMFGLNRVYVFGKEENAPLSNQSAQHV